MSSVASGAGGRIRAIRLRERMSQAEFAEILGFSKWALIKWEKGTAAPPISILVTLHRVFDVDPRWVVLGEDAFPGNSFQKVDWQRLDRIESKVNRLCQDARLDLTASQISVLVRGLYDMDDEREELEGLEKMAREWRDRKKDKKKHPDTPK